ncbi:1751_t:CDS:2 [Acaulospora morrowiae]|uniref:Peroxisomal membrane protein PEX14 n=1 Tax=Acaulospora morrowiae TaxID=94023 RepID=A0A9N8ZEN4_9GLOM|nr:1751_t:CDS:2 [Acaulospora morrowiae]
MSIRQELVKSAVDFLNDPKVQSSPLQKRVAFLERKGLTSNEIEEAIKQAKGGGGELPTAAVPSQVQTLPVSAQVALAPPPPVPRLDWRDFFIGAVLIGGIGYAMVEVAKKYIGPLLKTPTADELERDKQFLSDQFTIASETLDIVKADTNVARKNIDEQSSRIKETLETLDNLLKDMKVQEEKRDNDLKILKEDVDAIRNLIPKLIEGTKESQAQSLAELQSELKSLKSLLSNRRISTGSPITEALTSASTPATTNATSPTISPTLPFSSTAPGRPSIPAWQMGTNISTAAKVPVEQNPSEQNGTATSNGVENNVSQ